MRLELTPDTKELGGILTLYSTNLLTKPQLEKLTWGFLVTIAGENYSAGYDAENWVASYQPCTSEYCGKMMFESWWRSNGPFDLQQLYRSLHARSELTRISNTNLVIQSFEGNWSFQWRTGEREIKESFAGWRVQIGVDPLDAVHALIEADGGQEKQITSEKFDATIRRIFASHHLPLPRQSLESTIAICGF